MKRVLSVILALVFLMAAIPVSAAEEDTLRILFTHDIHSYFMNTAAEIDGKVRSHGGAARLKTLLDENKTENSVYLDAGDFSMGTLLQAGYSTDAYELRLLGELGCAATTFGNHEFDFGDDGMAEMLRNAKKSGDILPEIVESNMITDGDLTSEQKNLSDAMKDYGVKKYTIVQAGKYKIAVFGLFGVDSLSCAPTTNMEFKACIDAAKETLEEIEKNEKVDFTVCVSHSGTEGGGKEGEDVELAENVDGIDVIVSGHTHSTFEKPVSVNGTLLVSCGEYLKNLGLLDISVKDGKISAEDYRLIPIDETVKEDEKIAEKVEEYKSRIDDTYLKDAGATFDEVLCKNDIDFQTLDEMTAAHEEYPFGNLIADSYIYEAQQNGIDDIDVALVGLGTVRGSFEKGDVTTADAFEICSLGVGADGSAGHPIVSAYITGKELKLMTELDASLGPLVSYIKMSYSGLSFTFNTKRMLLDRVTECHLVRADGTTEEIEDEKLYRVACNMYAANMLGMLNGLTKGILKIVPKDENGNPIEDFYAFSLKDKEGREIKEWVAFKDYLASMPEKNGTPAISEKYAAPEGRKIKVSEGGLAIIKNPGGVTIAVMALAALILALIIVLIATRRKRKAKRKAKKSR